MIYGLEEFKLERKQALLSGDADKIRAFAKKYSMHHLSQLSDEDLLEAALLVPIWD